MLTLTHLQRLINALDFSVDPPQPRTPDAALNAEIAGIISDIYGTSRKKAFIEIKEKLSKNEEIDGALFQKLASLVQLSKKIKAAAIKLNRFYNWRSDEKPQLPIPSITVPLDSVSEDQDLYQKVCMQKYQQAMKLMEHSVCDVALEYVTRKSATQADDKSNRGILLDFADTYAQRYLDLYQAYIDWEITQSIPVLPVTAGQMKLHGFTSQEIWRMKNSCAKFSQIYADILSQCHNDEQACSDFVAILSNNNKALNREELLVFLTNGQFKEAERELNKNGMKVNEAETKVLLQLCASYAQLPERDLLDKAIMLMHGFGHMSYPEIAMQFYYVGIAKEDKSYVELAKENKAIDTVKNPDDREERLLMEIRHRIAGDMSSQQNSPGSIGGNPQAYLNMLKKGEPDNPLAEFREKMYFVYMSNHFANAIMKDPSIVEHINTWLRKEGKGWQLDKEFIAALQERGAEYLPPIFRYGANAALNRQLRDMRDHDEVAEFYRLNPNISIRYAMEGTYDLNDYYRYALSQRELLNQIGELKWDKQDVNRTWQTLNFGTGASVFKLREQETQDMSPEAKRYLQQVQSLGLPVFAGISGTLDQSTAMAGLIGLGIEADTQARKKTLETIRLAYLAFMLPGRDHSVHEIMQSSTTYGLEYVPGPGYEQYILPADEERVKQRLAEAQAKRDSRLPGYYLSEEFIKSAECRQLVESAKKMQQASSTVQSAPGAPVRGQTEPRQENYFVGLNLAGSTLSQAIQDKTKNYPEMAYWVKPSNLHITVGWIEEQLSPQQSREVAELLAEHMSKLSAMDVQVGEIQAWDNDIVLTLHSDTIKKLREAMEPELKQAKLTFKWEDVVHIKIGELKPSQTLSSLKTEIDDLRNKPFSFNNCAMMHYNPQTWTLQNDMVFPLGQRRSYLPSGTSGSTLTGIPKSSTQGLTFTGTPQSSASDSTSTKGPNSALHKKR